MSERLQSDPATIRAAMGKRNGIVHDMPEADYHAHSALSSTGARRLLESPAKFQYERTHPRAGRAAFDLGTAVHTKVLGTGAGAIAYPDEHLTPSGNVSTKAATVEWAEEQRGLGLTPLAPAQMREVDAMAEAVLAHSIARKLAEQPGMQEASVFATDAHTGVQARCRYDFLPDLDGPQPIAWDLKTTAKSASAEEFTKTVLNLGYDVQDTFYDRVLQSAVGAEIPFVFVVVEVDAPHLVNVHQLDIVFREMGKTKVQRALETFAQCTESGVWPGFPEEVNLLSPPVWAVYQHEERYPS
ncbi:PD-(D/E)XK nuclease-like domain-containing protein [Plantibacter auratus]|uniref:PD-(D/E)XK nuclease-like domain-containing protein n=1 Tax=Plantibacter auratus TaxID=272914 RepID=UPI003D32BE2A